MRTLTASFEAQIAARELTRARCVWIELPDLTPIGFTDHDEDIEVTVAGTTVLFECARGVLPSDIEMSIGLESDSCELTGPLNEWMTRASLIGRLFQDCRVRIFDVDWSSDEPAENPVFGGRIADSKVIGNEFALEIRGPTHRLHQTIGRVLGPYCTADYGDDQCGVVRTEYACTVTSVTSHFQFTTSLAGAHPDDFFNLGTIGFTTGDLTRIQEYEIFDYWGAGGYCELLAPLPARPAVGDQLVLRRGCSKLKMYPDDLTIPTCLTNNNVLRFGAFDRVPGSDNYLKLAVPQP